MKRWTDRFMTPEGRKLCTLLTAFPKAWEVIRVEPRYPVLRQHHFIMSARDITLVHNFGASWGHHFYLRDAPRLLNWADERAFVALLLPRIYPTLPDPAEAVRKRIMDV